MLELKSYISQGLSAREVSENFLFGIKDFINNKGSIRKLKNIHVLNFHGNLQSDNFCKIIYNNAHIYMERKYNVYLKGFIPLRYFIDNSIKY